jgi:hypothetical protein
MESASTRAKPAALTLRKLALKTPWQAFVLPVSVFPIPAGEFELVRRVLQRFTVVASVRWGLSLEAFLQLEQLQHSEARREYAQHARDWIPEVGLGVWPDRAPPKSWTKEEFEQAALENKRPRPLIYSVFQITGSSQAKIQAHDVMLHFGALVEFLTGLASDELLRRTGGALSPPIQDPSYTCFPFYVPLLEAKSLETARPEQLGAWIPGNSIYIRESFEDAGILIASGMPISGVFEELGASHSVDESEWRVPVGTGNSIF